MSIVGLSADRSASHRSLQVISEVKCVVRELVENAIDAGATDIVIKLVDQGLTSISVSDNASGIEAFNFEQLAKRSSTSKIKQFEDIFTSLSSHGFRGEALNSIANVSTLEVETRVAKEEVGWYLKFDRDGSLIEKTPIAKKVGTVVTSSKLFEPYPVRRNLLIKGAKSQATGAVGIVQQYALIYPEIRFLLTNMSSTNHQISSLFSSTGTSKSIREVSGEIFGSNFIKNVLDIKLTRDTWSVEGIISTPQTGRQNNDIQILFINRRPVDGMKKLKRCIKDVHKQFSSKYNVAYVLNINIDSKHVDVNLAPDKRRLFLMQEDTITRQLKEGILELYMMRMAKDSITNDPLRMKQLQFSRSSTASSPDMQSSRTESTDSFVFCPGNEVNGDHRDPGPRGNAKCKQRSLQSFMVTSTRDNSVLKNSNTIDQWFADDHKVKAVVNRMPSSSRAETADSSSVSTLSIHEEVLDAYAMSMVCTQQSLTTVYNSSNDMNIAKDSTDSGGIDITELTYNTDRIVKQEPLAHTPRDVDTPDPQFNGDSNSSTTLEYNSTPEEDGVPIKLDPHLSVVKQEVVARDSLTDAQEIASTQSNVDRPSPRTEDAVNSDTAQTNEVLNLKLQRVYDDNFRKSEVYRMFGSSSEPGFHPIDTETIDPKIFLRMQVCGQFNNGFIIAKLESKYSESNKVKYAVYLIDPHAADEKTKFEKYNSSVKIQRQPLVCERKVDLSPFHQQVVQANLDLLYENGFAATVVRQVVNDEGGYNREPGIYLSSFPQVLGQILGEEDFVSFVHDLAQSGSSSQPDPTNTSASQVLWGANTILPRPKRIWNILANRACKDAVKLGDPLTMKQMIVIKDRLAGLVHPWNCPHGRPTMKCLITTEQINSIITQ
ncbi:DNA mismatch repair protein C-terminal domain family protein [Babesia bovis T2Bo]|uniref:DNA mismatch repair protein, putative n=1 Tax=Babesia bovis TaxID=5865 RepID=A7AVE2_BABBO|nr:DNA mismatch repair protein C-terminal domain family protein [Babesia bovis T2Bo]EDO05768.1 DNA mismatch repair protein C-terminal domain family protein [Babesia bovis T2Bo]|eukprot:XP_001609336.1 DNA mismatch repair protein [Babesia bovis T2Bo]